MWDPKCTCTSSTVYIADILHWHSFVQSSPMGEKGKWKHHFLRLMISPPFFLAVSGLDFTGCFICLIYVPCPDCYLVPACSSHMAVPHTLMRCPISRNTNRVLSPSLWLYDVWTHKSFPETSGQGRSKKDQARGPSVYFRGSLFLVTWLTPDPYIKKEVESLRRLELFSNFSDSSFLFMGRKFYCSNILS